MIDPNAESDANRRAAGVVLARMEAMRTFAFEQIATASKWLLASLLTINGGGAVATVSNLKEFSHPVVPAAYFAGGILTVLLSAVVIQHSTASMLGPVERISYYWREVQHDGLRDLDIETQNDRDLRWRRWLGYLAPVLGWVSAVLFVGGVYSLTKAVPPSNLETAQALERGVRTQPPIGRLDQHKPAPPKRGDKCSRRE